MNDEQADRPTTKKPYDPPTLERYGSVGELTKALMDDGGAFDGQKGMTNKT